MIIRSTDSHLRRFVDVLRLTLFRKSSKNLTGGEGWRFQLSLCASTQVFAKTVHGNTLMEAQVTTFTSNDVESNVATFLKHIDPPDKYLVMGYIRRKSLKTNLNIPSSIAYYIIIYLFAFLEKFDEIKNFYENIIKIENKESKAIYLKDAYVWSNIFGIKTISMNTGIHTWSLKLSNHNTKRYVLIGIIPREKIEQFEQNYIIDDYTWGGEKWIAHKWWNGNGFYLGTGDFIKSSIWGLEHARYFEPGTLWNNHFRKKEKDVYIKMIFNTKNSDTYHPTLKFLVNGTKSEIQEYVVMDSNLFNRFKYFKLAISCRQKCTIQLMSYRGSSSM